MSGERDVPRGEEAGRLPSLEEQTPGLDTEQERRTEADARAFYEGQGGGQGQGDQGGAGGGSGTSKAPNELARHAGSPLPAGQGDVQPGDGEKGRGA